MLAGKRIFVASGDRDWMVPPENLARLIAQMEGLAAVVTHHRSPGGHELTRSEVEAAASWASPAA
jgi:phospholipase/carboxylesterase